jgi:acyl-homoserine lactone acylase PvdQ
MKKLQLVALGVLIGFVFAAALGGLTIAGAQQQGPSPMEAQKLLDKEKANLNQMGMMYTQMQTDMNSTMQMQMTPTEKAMMKQISELANMVHMLWQSNNDLLNVIQMNMGAKNK